jgi:ParB-like chromosome segregation protein Spo0J
MSDSESSVQLKTEIELVPIDELEPYANNPKEHPQSQVESIKHSIKNHGFDVPIVVNGDGTIIKGHGRFEAVKELDVERAPVIWRDGMSPDEVTSARIADNKTQMNSGFNYEKLSSEFESLETDFGVETDEIATNTGFNESVVDDLTTDDTPDADELFDVDDEDGDDGAGDTESDGASDNDGDEPGDDAGESGGQDDANSDTDTTGDGQSDPVVCPECGHTFDPE